MPDRFHFTEETVGAAVLPPGKKDKLYFDTETRGFGLRVNPKSRTLLAQFRTTTKVRRVRIGTWGVLTVAQARKQAKIILGAAAGGRDVVAERKAKAEADREAAREEAFTFGLMVKDWAEARKGDRRPSYLIEAVKCCDRNLGDWRKRPASTITPKDAARELTRLKTEKGITTANRTRAYASAAYGWAMGEHLVTSNPFKGLPRPGKEKPRERVLATEELQAIWAAAATLSALSGSYVRVLMLTLQRREEVASMQWGELAPDAATWNLPGARAKNGRATIVHLSEAAQTIIACMPKVRDNPHVFAGARKGKPIRGFNATKAQLDRAIAAAGHKLAPWSFHDFRRSGVTALAGMGFAPHVCDRILNHITGSIQGVAAVYQRHEFLAERKAALDAWAGLVAAGRPHHGNVVPMRGAA